MISELYNHQKEALEFIKDKKFSALFMEMGTGKTRIVIEQSKRLFFENNISAVVIIAPNSVKEQWITEQYPLYFNDPRWIGYIWDGVHTIKSKNNFFEVLYIKDKLRIFSFNVESFQSGSVDQFIKEIAKIKNILIVVDESTKIKNGRRKPTRGKRAGAIRTNKILDLFKNSEYKIILTGTPTPRSPFDLWAQFEFLKFDYFKMDYFFFIHHYGIQIQHTNFNNQKKYFSVLSEKEYNIIKNELKKYSILEPKIIEQMAIKYGMQTGDIIYINKMKEYSGYKNLNELKDKIKPITFFIRKKDCLDLPDKVYEVLYALLEGEQKRIYNELKKSLYTEYAGKELNVTSKMVLYMRLQAVTGGLFPFSETDIRVTNSGEEVFDTQYKSVYINESCKIKILLDDLENVSEDTFIIIWARFRAEIELIQSSLLQEGYTCEKYYGGSNFKVIEDFKSKKFRVLIATTEKGGEGLNLQIATLHYFYSNNFKADSRLQAEDRSHRAGQTNKVTYKDIICKGTVDEHILNVLKRKEDLINYFRNRSLEDILL